MFGAGAECLAVGEGAGAIRKPNPVAAYSPRPMVIPLPPRFPEGAASRWSCSAERPTRELWAGHPLTLPYLVLLLAGFAELPRSPGALVGSYPTVSPLPDGRTSLPGRRSVLCGTFLPVTGTGCYPAQCPVEFGLSSPRNAPGSDHPSRSGPWSS